MTIAVITSFDQHYYQRIGHDCVESWLQHWPEALKLTCYVENFRIPSQTRIDQIDFEHLCEEYRQFQASDEKPRVKTFAKKAYCVIHAMEHIDCDLLIWIDADTITTADVHEQEIAELCPEHVCATFMGVQHHLHKHDLSSPLMFSAETGFFILNKRHRGFQQFATRYREYYDRRLKQNLRRFYDGEVFGAVVQDLQDRVSFLDLCRDLPKSYNSPLKHTPVGRFLIHHKSKHSKDDFVAIKNNQANKTQCEES